VEGRYNHFVPRLTEERSYSVITVGGLINIYFGEEGRTRKAKKDAEMARRRENLALAEAKRHQQEAEQAKRQVKSSRNAALEAKLAMNLAQAELEKIKEMVARKAINPVKFSSGLDVLEIDSYETLDLVGDIANKYPDLTLRIEGHTDSLGRAESNLCLSQRRSNSVRQYLIDFSTLSPGRVVFGGIW